MKTNQVNSSDTGAAEILETLRSQFPGQVALTRDQVARACGFKNAITIDRARARGLIRPNVATRRPVYPLVEVARFLAQ